MVGLLLPSVGQRRLPPSVGQRRLPPSVGQRRLPPSASAFQQQCLRSRSEAARGATRAPQHCCSGCSGCTALASAAVLAAGQHGVQHTGQVGLDAAPVHIRVAAAHEGAAV